MLQFDTNIDGTPTRRVSDPLEVSAYTQTVRCHEVYLRCRPWCGAPIKNDATACPTLYTHNWKY